MSLTLTLSAAVVSSAVVGQAGQVQTYTNAIEPSRSEGVFTDRRFAPAADPREELLNPAPYPRARTDSPSRIQNGRLWYSRYPIGTRTPIDELPRINDGGGPASFGAPPEALDDVIFVKSEIPNVGVIAISPWDDLDTDTVELIRQDDPRLGRKPRPTDFRGPPLGYELETRKRSRALLDELKAAQTLWLKEQGYILSVRTHVNPRVLYGAQTRPTSAPASPEAPVEPRGVIKVRPKSTDSERRAEAQDSGRQAPIVVVRSTSADAPSD